MTAQLNHPRHSLVKQTRKQLSAAAKHEAENMQPFIRGLNTQLRNYARSNAEDRAALRPEIEKSVRKIERARDGR